MAFAEDVADLIAAEVSHIGLSADGTTEYAGGSYVHLVPTYGAAVAGEADITATLAFAGAANAGPITHLIYKRAGTAWTFVAVTSQLFNSDGRLDVTSAAVSAALA